MSPPAGLSAPSPGAEARKAKPARASLRIAAASGPAPRSLRALKAATDACRECPIGQFATQAVVGAGPRRAALMMVGEQPGDREDLAGLPFVGPAGRLLDQALEAAGIERSSVFMTNAVKHFKFELRGKRRIHKTPGQREALACLHWLEDEIRLIRPQAFVALGARAARSLLGRMVPVLRVQGSWLFRPDGRGVLVTVHPSSIVRLQGDERQEALQRFIRELARAAEGPPAARAEEQALAEAAG